MKTSELAAVIMSLRAARGWSQSELAKRAGLSRNCITLIESESERANSTLSTLQNIFGAFDLDIKIEFRPKATPNKVLQPTADPVTRDWDTPEEDEAWNGL